MEHIDLVGLDSCFTYEKLKNGLEIYLLPMTNKKNYAITFATRFGSDTTTFIPINGNKEITVPCGIAHFLEHKLFAQEDSDPFTFYAKTGSEINASTSYNNTKFICAGTKNFTENLDYLLNFVTNPYFTDENVESEKKIICEEINMYKDIPEYALEEAIKRNLYNSYSRRMDISGTVTSVNSITKEDLYTCYDTFYQPSNMFVLIVGNFKEEEALKIIKNRLDNDKENKPIIEKIYQEEKTVSKKMEIINSNINIEKLAYGLKLAKNDLGIEEDFKLDLCLQMIITSAFGITSNFRETMLSNNLLSNFYVEIDTTPDYKTLLLFAESNNIDKLIIEINKEFKNLKVSVEDFERIKKVWVASEVKIMDFIANVMYNQFDDIIRYKKILSNKISLIKSLEKSDVDKVIKNMDLKNVAIVKLLKSKERSEVSEKEKK